MSKAEGANHDRIAVLLVHGTNDGAETTTGSKWWQTGSRFSTALIEALARRGENAELVPFQWSGANSDQARRIGARALAKAMRERRRQYRSLHIVAHSHGGNVANSAADEIRWDVPRVPSSLASCIAVGTPFIKRHISWMQIFSAYAFLAISLLGAPVWAAMAAPQLIAAIQDNGSSQSTIAGLIIGTLLGGAVVLLPIAITLWVALRNVWRLARRRIDARSTKSILAIRHPQDEAISFLQKVDTVALEPIPKGALMRGSGKLAITISVQAVIWIAVFILAMLIFKALQFDAKEWPFGLGALAIGIIRHPTKALLWSYPLFCLVYLVGRLVFGIVPELTLRGFFNSRLVNSLRGIALGADGVERLGEVATKSHTQKTTEVLLEGAIVEHMKSNAARTASDLIDKYRWSLFTAGADANRSLAELAEDAMTWKSLIHTTYFDQPEIVELIAGHIADAAKNARTA